MEPPVGSSGLSSNEVKVEALGQGLVGVSSVDRVDPEVSDLELGLSLGGGGGGGGVRCKSSPWGECGRILTAKDFPCVLSHGSSASPGFSVSGTKRVADSGPQDGGSPPRSSQVVGWPPIRAHRMNSLVNQTKTPKAEEDKAIDGKEKSNDALKNNTATLKSKGHNGFVKVNMDGIPIGRKADLNAHACYATLAQTLEDMFLNPATTRLHAIESCGQKEIPMKLCKLLDGSSEFVLTYEDKEGDWMLVGDVPWRMFVSTVKRLRIMKTSKANGLAPTGQDKN